MAHDPGPGLPNDDSRLLEEAERVVSERREAGLEGMVGGLEFVVINAEPEGQEAAAAELLSSTGLSCVAAHECARFREYVLQTDGSADVVVRSRRVGPNPFAEMNDRPNTRRLPNTRLETLCFRVTDLSRYAEIQRKRGVRFLEDEIEDNELYRFIQTTPSRYTGNSTGFVEWKVAGRAYSHRGCRPLPPLQKPELPYLKNIGRLDHIATRVTAADRDPAILEFMSLTNYRFDFAVYVEQLNSITNVARLSPSDFALVFTSGIAAPSIGSPPGPTERFVELYGPRVHHMAFDTGSIEETCSSLERDGMRYLVELVGSPEEGLKQTFTVPFAHTMLVNEYIHRYGDFAGFFAKSNVTLLTAASGKAYGD